MKIENEGPANVENHPVVSHEEWLAARKALLVREKEFTRLRDEMNAARRALAWERVAKDYVFDGAEGKRSLAELFDGRSQLLIYHFMFAPDWDAGCKSCSFLADHFNSIIVHLHHRDISFAAVSRAPYAKLAAYENRMGWSFPWFSSADNNFNFDYNISFTPGELAAKSGEYNYRVRDPQSSELPGLSVFYKDTEGNIFHTYSVFERGLDPFVTAYQYIDLVPKGRDEGGHGMFWVRRHDEY